MTTRKIDRRKNTHWQQLLECTKKTLDMLCSKKLNLLSNQDKHDWPKRSRHRECNEDFNYEQIRDNLCGLWAAVDAFFLLKLFKLCLLTDLCLISRDAKIADRKKGSFYLTLYLVYLLAHCTCPEHQINFKLAHLWFTCTNKE